MATLMVPLSISVLSALMYAREVLVLSAPLILRLMTEPALALIMLVA